MIRCIVGWLILTSIGWALDSVRVVKSGRPFAAHTTIPVMNRGYLFFITHTSPELDAYAPDGQLAFATVIQGPGGAIARLADAAVDDQGRVAVGVSFTTDANTFQGAIVLLDATGKQTGIFSTGRYVPSYLCFAPDGTIWTSGWQRGAVKNHMEDPEDYFVIRRFSMLGQQTGAFVKRSSFPPGLAPGGAWGGRWGIRAAGDRIGALMFSGRTSERLVWLELDSSGKELGRWTLPAGFTQGMAFTSNALYAVTMTWDREKKSGQWELDEFDKDRAVWNAISKAPYTLENPCNCGVLMDADGDELVLEKDHGAFLEWVKP